MKAPMPSDRFSRTPFLAAIENHIDGLAAVPLDQLPSPRVIGVDARWGHGKSWVANSLVERLRAGDAPHLTVLIDAFRYDHHDDAFSVIASAVMSALKPKDEAKKKFLSAAGAVLSVAAPLAVKAAASIGLKAIGLSPDDMSEAVQKVAEGAVEGAGGLSNKAVEKLFEKYSSTQSVQDQFVKVLGQLTSDLEKPLVIVIDELDRCRPNFALQILESIKHLFSADNVVFVLFWNVESIYESIRHTYGTGTNAENYLSKFVAFSLPLPKPTGRSPTQRYGSFIEAEIVSAMGADNWQFRDALSEIAGILSPSPRDIQKVVQLHARLPIDDDRFWPGYAYLLLLKVQNDRALEKIERSNSDVISAEIDRIGWTLPEHGASALRSVRAVLYWTLNGQRLQELLSKTEDANQYELATLQSFDDARCVKWLIGEAKEIRLGLTERKAK